MKLSLRFFYTKLAKEYPDAFLELKTETMPNFTTHGIVSGNMKPMEDILYIDLLESDSKNDAACFSVITTRQRETRFRHCNRIVLPDDTDLLSVVEYVSGIFTCYFNWADAVNEAISKNTSLQVIIDLTQPLVNNPLYIADSSFKMLASWGGDLGEVNPTWIYQQRFGYLPYEVMQNLIDSGELEKHHNTVKAWKVINSAGFPELNFISKSILKEGVHYGNVYFIELYDFLDDCALELADYLGSVLSTALYGNQNYLEKSELYNTHFLVEVITGTLTDKAVMADQLRAFHWEIEGDYLLALFDTRGDNDAIRHHMMALLTTGFAAQCLSYNGDVLVIINNCGNAYERIISRLAYIAKNFHRTAAVSDRFIIFSEIDKCYQQAFTALGDEDRAGRGKLVAYSEIFLDQARERLSTMVPISLSAARLKRHDDRFNTDYCRVLLAWLSNERNSGKTAESLYIHRNTLKNRIERISQIIEDDLDDFETRMRLILSLSILLQEEY